MKPEPSLYMAPLVLTSHNEVCSSFLYRFHQEKPASLDQFLYAIPATQSALAGFQACHVALLLSLFFKSKSKLGKSPVNDPKITFKPKLIPDFTGINRIIGLT